MTKVKQNHEIKITSVTLDPNLVNVGHIDGILIISIMSVL